MSNFYTTTFLHGIQDWRLVSEQKPFFFVSLQVVLEGKKDYCFATFACTWISSAWIFQKCILTFIIDGLCNQSICVDQGSCRRGIFPVCNDSFTKMMATTLQRRHRASMAESHLLVTCHSLLLHTGSVPVPAGTKQSGDQIVLLSYNNFVMESECCECTSAKNEYDGIWVLWLSLTVINWCLYAGYHCML